MPRASWRGYLRLSLVSCPIYLMPATTRTKSIRLHQVWRPTAAEEPEDLLDEMRDGDREDGPVPAFSRENGYEEEDPTRAATGMVLITLRVTEEVRSPQFAVADGAVDPEMLAIARAIIGQRIGKFDASKFRDRYQEALRELIEAKMKGLPIKPREVPTPTPVID